MTREEARLTRFFLLTIGLILTSCSSGKRGDVFVDYFGKNLVVKTDGKTTKYKLDSPIKGEPSIFRDEEDVYMISMTNNIAKFSLKNHSIAWQKTIASVPRANFTPAGGKLYFTTLNNSFYILDSETGKIEFIHSNANRTTITTCIKPILYKNLLVVTFNDGEVIIFDKNSRNILKKIASTPYGKTSVVLENNILTVNSEKIDLSKMGKK
ncbi:MAG: hypothetical protein LBB13_00955 [Rickettsiales bacterium]|jgi:outer membrane protein assembly factor BamB|nr:hypothetical protein [Rickettsiales bacterium]